MALLKRGFSDPAFEQGQASEFDRFVASVWESLLEDHREADGRVSISRADLVAAIGFVNTSFK